jgi:hypothetical protein
MEKKAKSERRIGEMSGLEVEVDVDLRLVA